MSREHDEDVLAIVEAARQYIEEETSIYDFEIVFEALDGDHARLRVTPRDQRTDAAYCFTRRGTERWSVFAIGTAFDATALAKRGIPNSLWPS